MFFPVASAEPHGGGGEVGHGHVHLPNKVRSVWLLNKIIPGNWIMSSLNIKHSSKIMPANLENIELLKSLLKKLRLSYFNKHMIKKSYSVNLRNSTCHQILD